MTRKFNRINTRRWMCTLVAPLFVVALFAGAMTACDGATGPAGNDGTEGPAGSDGPGALVSVTVEAAGANCADGGLMIESGIDDNGDGTLDAAEVDTTTYVCNGEGGDPGDPGDPGVSALVNITDEPAGDNCASGGQMVEAGIDDNGDGILDPAEVDTTNYVCNGENLLPETSESCAVCHGEEKTVDVALNHPDPAPALNVTVTAITDIGAGLLEVSFSLADEAGDPVTGIALGGNRFYISDMVPAGTPTASWGTWDSDYPERWAYERDSAGYPLGTWAELGLGDYTYTFATALGSAEALLEAPDYDANHTQRLVMRVDGRDYGLTRAVGIQDFLVDGTLVDPVRVSAATDGCTKCHSSEMDNAAHGGSYLDTRACLMCHSPIGHYGDEMQTDDAWLTPLIHKLHAAIPMPAFDNRIGGLGYGAVTYPQEIQNCATCHTGNNFETDDWKTHPTAEACGSCHDDVDFPVGTNHGPAELPQADNASCHLCHTDVLIEEKHALVEAAVDVPEFDVNLSITAPANAEYYVEGEAPMVTVTLTNHADGSDIDPAFYTTAQGDAGVTDDLALRVASVYVYGPRANALPVLATGTVTDPAFDPTGSPSQGHSMFTDAGDAQVMTDASGFKYQLFAIPADMAAGTYLVRVRMGDYSRVEAGDYHIESTAFTTIQIGTVDEEAKVAGDACFDCHNTGNFHPHNERHSVVFDTDECLSCHDQSGNYARPIGNRVHAIHSANSDGDIYTIQGGHRDWEHVTYPANTERCVTCHTEASTYMTEQYMNPCAGCHVENGNGVVDHMRQNGGPY